MEAQIANLASGALISEKIILTTPFVAEKHPFLNIEIGPFHIEKSSAVYLHHALF